MTGSFRPILAAALVIAALPLASALAGDGPAHRFSLTAVVETDSATRRMPATIEVRRYTSRDEGQQLRGILQNAGEGALVATLQTRQDGHIELGGLRSPLALAGAALQDDTWHYLFLTPRHLKLEQEQTGGSARNYPFGMAILRIGPGGRAEGELHVAAALRIAEDGWVEVYDHDGAEGRLEDIRVER